MIARHRNIRTRTVATLLSVLALGVTVPAAGAEIEAPATAGAEIVAPAAARAEAPVPPAPNRPPVEKRVRLAHSDRNVVRTGPGGDFALVGVYAKGSTFAVIAKSGEWYNIRLSSTETGWIHASLCEEYDDLSVLEFRPNPRLFSRVGSFVLTGQLAGYSFDRKSNSVAVGARLGYYLFDFVQVEGSLSYTHVVRPQEIVESLFDLRLEEERFDMLFYDLNATVEILPGRQMVPFLTAGAGSVILLGRAEPSFNIGAGTMLYTGKTAAMRWEVRNHRFTSGTESARRTSSNFEMILGFSLLK